MRFPSLARSFEIDTTSEDSVVLTEVVHRLAVAPATALSHGDPCPGSDLYLDNSTAYGEGATVRFVDFEQASLGDGLVELAYLRIGFPSCGYSIAAAAPYVEQAELAYREAWCAATGTASGATSSHASPTAARAG